MVAAGLSAFAAPSVTVNELKTVWPWDSTKGTISVDYSLAGISTATEYKIGDRDR